VESIPQPHTNQPDTASRTTESRRRANGLEDNTGGEETGTYNHVRPDYSATDKKKTDRGPGDDQAKKKGHGQDDGVFGKEKRRSHPTNRTAVDNPAGHQRV